MQLNLIFLKGQQGAAYLIVKRLGYTEVHGKMAPQLPLGPQ